MCILMHVYTKIAINFLFAWIMSGIWGVEKPCVLSIWSSCAFKRCNRSALDEDLVSSMVGAGGTWFRHGVATGWEPTAGAQSFCFGTITSVGFLARSCGWSGPGEWNLRQIFLKGINDLVEFILHSLWFLKTIVHDWLHGSLERIKGNLLRIITFTHIVKDWIIMNCSHRSPVLHRRTFILNLDTIPA